MSRDTPLRYFAKNVFARLSAGIGYGFNGLTKNLYDGTMSLRLLIWTAEGGRPASANVKKTKTAAPVTCRSRKTGLDPEQKEDI